MKKRMMKNGKPIKIGMHTYSLHLFGAGESWGFEGVHAFEKAMSLEEMMDYAVEWGLDGLHLTNVDLGSLDDENLANVKKMAEDRDLFLEYNVSFNAPSDPRVNSTVEDALKNAKKMGADLVKFSLDIKRPRPLVASYFHPEVMRQIADRYDEFEKNLPLMEELGLTISIENHTDMFADEVVYLVEKLNHPDVGACCDTKNGFCVTEGFWDTLNRMAPITNCTHMADQAIEIDPNGTHSIGRSLGQGDMDIYGCIKRFVEESPLYDNRIVFELEWAQHDDTIEVAREKQMENVKTSIDYLYNEVGIGVRRHNNN